MVTEKNLQLIRRYYGVSAKRLADMIGTTPQFISLIETGERPLPSERARQIERILGITPERFALIIETSAVLGEVRLV